MAEPNPSADYRRCVQALYGAGGGEEPLALGLDALGMDRCPAWRQAASELPAQRELWLSLADGALMDQRLGEALALVRRMDTLFPENAEITHKTGVILQIAGDGPGAAKLYEQALALNPEHRDAGLALAQLLARQDPQRAQGLLQRFASSDAMPFDQGLVQLISQLASPEATDRSAIDTTVQALAAGCDLDQHAQLVEVLFQTGQSERARQILDHPPAEKQDWPVLLHRFSILSRFLPSDVDAIDPLRRKLIQDYNAIPAVSLALSAHARANHRYQDSLDLAATALEPQPDHLALLRLVAANQLSLGRHREAIGVLERCLSINALQAEIQAMLGYASFAIGEIAASRSWLQHSLRLRPRAGLHWLDLAKALYLHGEPDQALLAASNACEASPGHPHATTIRGLLHLLLGNTASGWSDYESRNQSQGGSLCAPSDLERWDGSTELDDLVLVSEQGAGDLIQFLRYVPFLRLTIPRVSILVPERFRSLMELAGVFSAVFTYGDSIPIHGRGGWIPFMSVAGLLGVSADCVLIDEPYLQAPAPAVAHWRRILHRDAVDPAGKLIGLHWQGNPAAEDSLFAGRSFALEQLAPLAEIPGLTFLSLQKGTGSEQLNRCSFRDRFAAAQAEVDACWDYADNSAILSSCDLVITSDSGIAHLAGALGRPVWLLLARTPEWRWGLTGERTAWYPTMRIFRQNSAGDWHTVVKAVRAALAEAWASGDDDPTPL